MKKGKILPILFILGTIAAIVSGVLEVRVYPDKLSGVTEQATETIKSKAVWEKARKGAVNIKRKGEGYFVKDSEKKMEVVVGYVDADAKRLIELAEKGVSPNILTPQAQLLAKSVQKAGWQANELSDEQLVNVAETSQNALQNAVTALKKLQKLEKEYEEYKDQLSSITSVLEGSMNVPEGDVASAKDEKDEPPAPESTQPKEETPEEDIPLKF